MKKKIFIITAVIFLIINLLVILYFKRQNRPSSIFQNTVPIFKKTPIPDNPIPTRIYPKAVNIRTDLTKVGSVSADFSIPEIEKISNLLPYYIDKFKTTYSTTSISISIQDTDPPGTIRLEIYGINYAEKDLIGPHALSFKESFLEAKKYLINNKVNPKNINYIFSNYQYDQDTATSWVKSFSLLN